MPGFAMNGDNYKTVEDEFEDWIYRNERAEIFHSPLFDAYSQIGEGEGDFRARVALKAREARDEAVEKLRDKYQKKIKTKAGQRDRAELTVEKERAEATSATWQAGASIIGGLLGKLLGGRRKSVGSAVNSGSRAYKQRKDVGLAEDKVEALEEAIAELEAELQGEVAEMELEFDPQKADLETISIKPYKKDIDVKSVSLLWLPYDEHGDGTW